LEKGGWTLRWICRDRVFTSAREGAGGLERGATLTIAAIILPLVLVLGALVVDVGNWWVHGRHLQTKVDAAAFAGGGVWGFPCGPDVDASIEAQARQYVGPHTTAAGVVLTSGFNPQVGGTGADRIRVVLNGGDWWDDDAGAAPADRTDPLNPSICEAKVLDVKATEANADLLFGWLPFFPDIKRKARVEIQEVEGLTGLLPIAVRVPRPLSAAAVFYDEADGTVLDVKYLCERAGIPGLPAGLGGWTTLDTGMTPNPLCSSWANFNVAATTGVVVATSFRPACDAPGATGPCLEDSGWISQQVDDFCRQAQGVVECSDATGAGTSQTVLSGVQFIRGYPTGDAGTGPPQLRSAYLDAPSPNCYAYFTSVPFSCSTRLNVAVDLGALEGSYPNPDPPPAPPFVTEQLRAQDVEVRYRLVRSDGTSFCDYGVTCDLLPPGPNLPITVSSQGNAVAIQIKLRNATNSSDPDCTGGDFNDSCRWFYTGNGVFSTSVAPTDAEILAAPIQRSFMGDIDLTGPIKWLRLTSGEVDANGICVPTLMDGEAASHPVGSSRCFYIDMGLQGGIAQDQDEPPIALNLGTGASQRALIDCDPNITNLKSEVVSGCLWPSYAANKFTTAPLCPGTNGFFDVPKAAPFDNWPSFRCVLTQTTAAANQIVQGFNERIFGDPTNPTCPPEDTAGYPPPPGSAAPWTKGRNYWHRDNNLIDDYTFAWDGDTPFDESDDWGNQLRDDDPRLVTLFFTTYDSFISPGNEVYAIVGFGNFLVTGYGRTSNGGWQGGAPDDPCSDGNDGDLTNGNGNEPPPDIDYSKNTTWVWGHFVNDVQPSPFTTGGSGVLCEPQASFMPCVAVLVE